MPKIRSQKILDGATASATTGEIRTSWTPNTTFQAVGTASGAGSAVIIIEASNVEAPTVQGEFVELGIITLTLIAGVVSDAFSIDAQYRHIRARTTSIIGPNASIDVWQSGSLGGG